MQHTHTHTHTYTLKERESGERKGVIESSKSLRAGVLSALLAYLLQGGGMKGRKGWGGGGLILLGVHVQSRDTEQEGSEGSEGEIELVHLQLVPKD